MPFLLESSRETDITLLSSSYSSDFSNSSTSNESITKDTTSNFVTTCGAIRDQKKTEPQEPPMKMFKDDKLHNHSHNVPFQFQSENNIVNIADYLKIELEIGHQKLSDDYTRIYNPTNENHHHNQERNRDKEMFQFKIDNVNDILKNLEPENCIQGECGSLNPAVGHSHSQIKKELKTEPDPDQIPYRRRSNLVCPICLEEFTTKRLKQNHMQKIHLVDIHCADLTSSGKHVVGNNCEFCSRKFARTDTKKRHKRRDHYPLWVRCKFEGCKEQFWLGSQLLDHFWTIHDARLSKASYYYCVICHKSNFFNAEQLDQHTYQAHKDSINFTYKLPQNIPTL